MGKTRRKIKDKTKISIIIPAYNEEKRISPTLESYGSFFNKLKKQDILDYEILVVINKSTDRTEEIVKNLGKKNKNIQYLNLKEKGKGLAIIEGFKSALKSKENFNLIGFVDADLSTRPEAFYDLVEKINGFDGIIASRYVKGAVVKPKQPLQRIIVSRVGNFLIRSLFLMPYRDTQCGAKLFKRMAIEKIKNKLGETQWAFDIDLIYLLKKSKLTIKEFPTVWEDKESSKLNIKKASIQMFFSVLQLRIVNSPFRRIFNPLKPIIKIIWKNIK